MVALKDKDLVSILLSSSKDTNLKPLLTAAWMREMMRKPGKRGPVVPKKKTKTKRKRPTVKKTTTNWKNTGTSNGNGNRMNTGSNRMNTGSNRMNTGSNRMNTGSNRMNTGSNRMNTGNGPKPFANTNVNPRPPYLAKRINDSLTRMGERMKGSLGSNRSNWPFTNQQRFGNSQSDPLGPLMAEIENNSRRARSNY